MANHGMVVICILATALAMVESKEVLRIPIDCEYFMSNMTNNCLGYLMANGNKTSPPVSCCNEIQALLQFNPQCGCYGLRKSIRMGLDLNITRIFSLNTVCHLNFTSFKCQISFPPVFPIDATPPRPSSVPSNPQAAPGPKTLAPPPAAAQSSQVLAPAPAPAHSSAAGITLLASHATVVVSFLVAAVFG